jgi:hypothetical protein
MANINFTCFKRMEIVFFCPKGVFQALYWASGIANALEQAVILYAQEHHG